TRAVTSTRVENRSLCVYWRVAVSANSWLRSSGRRAYSRVPRSMTVRGLPLAKRSKIFPRSMPCLPVGGGVQGHPADRLLTLTPTFKGRLREPYVGSATTYSHSRNERSLRHDLLENDAVHGPVKVGVRPRKLDHILVQMRLQALHWQGRCIQPNRGRDESNLRPVFRFLAG